MNFWQMLVGKGRQAEAPGLDALLEAPFPVEKIVEANVARLQAEFGGCGGENSYFYNGKSGTREGFLSADLNGKITAVHTGPVGDRDAVTIRVLFPIKRDGAPAGEPTQIFFDGKILPEGMHRLRESLDTFAEKAGLRFVYPEPKLPERHEPPQPLVVREIPGKTLEPTEYRHAFTEPLVDGTRVRILHNAEECVLKILSADSFARANSEAAAGNAAVKWWLVREDAPHEHYKALRPGEKIYLHAAQPSDYAPAINAINIPNLKSDQGAYMKARRTALDLQYASIARLGLPDGLPVSLSVQNNDNSTVDIASERCTGYRIEIPPRSIPVVSGRSGDTTVLIKPD